jgi:hypothetical protein
VRRREKRKRLFPFHACRMRRPFISGNGATVIHKPNNPDSTKLAKATPPSDPATGSFNGLHPKSKFLAMGGIPSTQQPLVARRATHLPSVFIRVRSS